MHQVRSRRSWPIEGHRQTLMQLDPTTPKNILPKYNRCKVFELSRKNLDQIKLKAGNLLLNCMHYLRMYS